MKKTLDVIIPCFNEAAVIRSTYKRLSDVLQAMHDISSSMIFIDDGSSDETLSILHELAISDPSVKLIAFSRNFGHQAAVTAGINHCTADMAVIIDADLQDPPELIPDMIRCKEAENANVVYCVRLKREGESIFKKLTAQLFYRSLNALAEVRFPVDTGDFRLIDSNVINEFNKFRERGKYIRGLISWIGFKQVPFYYERHVRFAGETKYPLCKMLKFATTALTYFSKKPLQLALALGGLTVMIGLVLTIWYVLGKIIGYTHSESGFTSIMIAIIFFGGIQLLTIGSLGQYIGVLFDEIKARPEYIIKEKQNIEE